VVGWTPSRENRPPSVRPWGPDRKNLVFGTGVSAFSSGGRSYGFHQLGSAAALQDHAPGPVVVPFDELRERIVARPALESLRDAVGIEQQDVEDVGAVDGEVVVRRRRRRHVPAVATLPVVLDGVHV
jgi:hypothetical protein